MQKNSRSRIFLIISFSIVFGWVMSLPYEGPVLYAFADIKAYNGVVLNSFSVFCHFLGLFLGRFLTKSSKDARSLIIKVLVGTVLVSGLLPFVPGSFWNVLVPIASLLTGLAITSYGHMIYDFVPMKKNLETMADLLIYGNVVLISAHVFANNTKPIISFVWIEILLLVSLYVILRMDVEEGLVQRVTNNDREKLKVKDYGIFFLFIYVITINSGIMFQVIYPYFSEFGLLTSLYTNVPYIISIFLLSRVIKINRFYFLYAGLILWGVTFLVFTVVGPTALGFIVVCTIMLSACGIFDLFWWSVIANNLGTVENPASLLGMGLATNVFGVWSGGILGNFIVSFGGDKQELAIIGLFVVIISMSVMVALNVKLSRLLIYSEFLYAIEEVASEDGMDAIKDILSNREFEVFDLLLSGKTDTQISEALNISKHTIKTHNRNIYRKLEVSNRVQLIEKYQ